MCEHVSLWIRILARLPSVAADGASGQDQVKRSAGVPRAHLAVEVNWGTRLI